MSSQESFKRVIQHINSGKKFPALQLVNRNVDNAAIISKLVKNQHAKEFDVANPNSFYNLDTSSFRSVADTISERMHDSENIMQLFPDMELAAQILISSILSPKDMVNSDIIYRMSEAVLPADVAMQLTKLLEKNLTQYYKLKTVLPDILRECLFISGSYVKAVIPESSIDEVINSNIYPSTESLSEVLNSDSLGILGNPTGGSKKITLESLTRSIATADYRPGLHVPDASSVQQKKMADLVEVTDNFKYLKLPSVIRRMRSSQMNSVIHRHSTESHETKFTNQEIENMFFRRVDIKEKPFVAFKTRDQTRRRSIGRPLELKIPTESIIPVYVPGDPKSHVGYFVILDEEGNPITYEASRDAIGNMNSAMSDHTNQVASMLTQKATYNLMGQTRKNLNLTDKAQVYMGIIESDLVNRLKNGAHGSKLEIARRTDVYQIMMARTLSGQYTRLLYMPAELVTYFALKYNNNGTGKSLLDDLKVLTSLRAILLFAKVMATAKNSINITKVNMTLDPNDPDPQKTIEMSVNEVMKMRQQYFPLGINTPTDLVDWVQRAGFEFTFEGHPGLPSTKFDFESKSFQHQVPDSELEENLRKQTIMALGLSPETVDNGFSSEFATTVVSNNILLSKRVMQIQEQFTPLLTDYVKKLIINDYTLRSEILQVLKENLASLDKYISQEERQMRDVDEGKFLEYMIDKFSLYIELSLPKPDITTVETQTAAFDQYVEALDKTLEYWVSSEFITPEIAGEFSNSVDAIKASLKAHFLRKWMAENGYMVELGDVISMDDDGLPVLDIYDMSKEHIQGVIRSSLKFIEKMQATKAAADQDVEDLDVNGTGPDTDSSSDYGSDDTDTIDDSSSDEDDAGGDDMGMDDVTDDFAAMGGKDDVSLDDVNS